jgi:hypothetical protein
MRSGCAAFNGPLLLALSGDDLTAKEFADSVAADSTWRKLLKRKDTQNLTLPGADHTLSNPGAQRAFEAAMLQWLSATAHRPTSTTAHH